MTSEDPPEYIYNVDHDHKVMNPDCVKCWQRVAHESQLQAGLMAEQLQEVAADRENWKEGHFQLTAELLRANRHADVCYTAVVETHKSIDRLMREMLAGRPAPKLIDLEALEATIVEQQKLLDTRLADIIRLEEIIASYAEAHEQSVKLFGGAIAPKFW